jgi:SAM-dependent methyltransferase
MLGAWSLKRIAWSVRKISLPIGTSDLVLDVGSGSNPHPAADVLLERYLDPAHRYSPMVIDRPTVLANACKMPFRDKAFDYSLAFHVLEHLSDPAAFLNELQRVSKAGYIETPNALFERITPYDVHLLEVMNVNDVLIIHKKPAARPDQFLNDLDILRHSTRWNRFFYANPSLFHVQYFWANQIHFTIENPDTPLTWFKEPRVESADNGNFSHAPASNGERSLGLSLMRKYYRLRKRKVVDLNAILCCPDCHGDLVAQNGSLICSTCQLSYERIPVPDFNSGLPLIQRGHTATASA